MSGASAAAPTDAYESVLYHSGTDDDSDDEFFDAKSVGSETGSSEVPSHNESIPDLEDPLGGLQSLDLNALVITNEAGDYATPHTQHSSAEEVSAIESEDTQSPALLTAASSLSSFPAVRTITTPSPMAPPRRKKGSKTTPTTDKTSNDGMFSVQSISTSPAPPPRVKRQKSSQSVVAQPSAAHSLSENKSQGSTETTPAWQVDPKVADINARDRRSQTPTDEEILDNVMVTCLDTGESVPMSRLHELLPEGTNPLSFKVIERTGEFSADQESLHEVDAVTDEGRTIRSKLKSAKDKTLAAASRASVAATTAAKALGDKLVDSIRRDDERVREEQERAEVAAGFVKMRTRSAKTQQLEGLRHLKCVQDLSSTHQGAIWTMKMSTCGRLLATAGQDKIVRVWVTTDSLEFFQNVQNAQNKSFTKSGATGAGTAGTSDGSHMLFQPKPFCEYSGHTADVLDLAWCHSKNYFLLSSSMDKTVRLWHVSRGECLASFLHEDFVTAIAFHPRNDKYFLSGSLDCKLRLWNIPEKKVALWNEVGSEGCNLITAANFCSGGKYAVAGTYDGRCVFFNTEERLKYHTQIHARSARGKNSKGRKVSGIEAMPGSDKILVTSNDSRVRLFDLKDHSLSCKYKGAVNTSSQIKATFSPDGKSIVCGSEDHQFYTWDTEPCPLPSGTRKRFRRDRNDEYQRFGAHQAVVTVAMFAPPNVDSQSREVMLSADYSGSIKIYVSQMDAKSSATVSQ